ncbi:helix-turn-helix transcriptional regulator [Aliarcobacter lanthieri]|uniref:helix-turn-helix transcriptional regulator n=1 Tax=Aliarcobacter lanthieri TaxID=1355374 RepID=UPI00047D3938|nr:helix-turn-helix domain-containing protein [Aliarcobacter lanthieri]
MKHLTEDKIFIRVNEASYLFGLSVSHLWSLIRNGTLKSFKPSEKITLIRVSDLISYIECIKEDA